MASKIVIHIYDDAGDELEILNVEWSYSPGQDPWSAKRKVLRASAGKWSKNWDGSADFFGGGKMVLHLDGVPNVGWNNPFSTGLSGEGYCFKRASTDSIQITWSVSFVRN